MNTIQWHNDPLTAANTAKDGTGTVAVVIKAAADIYVDRVIFRAIGSNVQSCGRLFVNNGESNTTANNNSLLAEITLSATTLDEAAAFTDNIIFTDLWLPSGYRLLATLGTAVASGYQISAVAGRYQDLQSNQGDN